MEMLALSDPAFYKPALAVAGLLICTGSILAVLVRVSR